MANAQLEQMKQQLATFKAGLEEYARRHRKEINRNPLLRQQFQQMCTAIGVDPLLSAKGFWADLLGVGDFYYELGVQVVEACLLAREATGGLVDFAPVRERIGKARGMTISEEDLIRAVETLKPLESGFAIVTIGGRRLIQSLPRELSHDHTLLLQSGQASGFLTHRSPPGWTGERYQLAVDSLVAEGMLWLDTQGSETVYWFPCFFPGLS